MTDESPSLSSNDCLMKDVSVLIFSGVDRVSIFANCCNAFKYESESKMYQAYKIFIRTLYLIIQNFINIKQPVLMIFSIF